MLLIRRELTRFLSRQVYREECGCIEIIRNLPAAGRLARAGRLVTRGGGRPPFGWGREILRSRCSAPFLRQGEQDSDPGRIGKCIDLALVMLLILKEKRRFLARQVYRLRKRLLRAVLAFAPSGLEERLAGRRERRYIAM
jgi:hypothetical protein